MVLPVGGDGGIDFARFLVEDRLRITVRANGTVYRLPDVELFAGSRMRAKC
jgi:hypothetical protein